MPQPGEVTGVVDYWASDMATFIGWYCVQDFRTSQYNNSGVDDGTLFVPIWIKYDAAFATLTDFAVNPYTGSISGDLTVTAKIPSANAVFENGSTTYIKNLELNGGTPGYLDMGGCYENPNPDINGLKTFYPSDVTISYNFHWELPGYSYSPAGDYAFIPTGWTTNPSGIFEPEDGPNYGASFSIGTVGTYTLTISFQFSRVNDQGVWTPVNGDASLVTIQRTFTVVSPDDGDWQTILPKDNPHTGE